jgi:hypothetical protein
MLLALASAVLLGSEDLGKLIGMRRMVKEYEALKRNISQRKEELEE